MMAGNLSTDVLLAVARFIDVQKLSCGAWTAAVMITFLLETWDLSGGDLWDIPTSSHWSLTGTFVK